MNDIGARLAEFESGELAVYRASLVENGALDTAQRARNQIVKNPRSRAHESEGIKANALRDFHLWFAVILAPFFLVGCASSVFDARRSETVLPLNRAWIDGRTVEYITTDISDPTMAKALGVNLVPRLSDAIAAPPGHSVLERVYKFPNNEQASVFQSAPRPAGAQNADASYSPLWRMVLVRWTSPAATRLLKSEEELLSAAEKGEVVLDVTNIVVNCPVTRGADGQAIRGVR